MNLPLTPVRCLYRAVDLYGAKLAVVAGGARYTYAGFAECCERLAAALLALNIVSGDRVALLSFNNDIFLGSYFAVPMIKAILLPLNVRLRAEELGTILRQAQPRVLLFEEDFRPVVNELKRMHLGITHFVCMEETHATGEPSLPQLMSAGRLPRPDIFSFDEDATAELFYTSGSTGEPKGVPLSHRSLYLHALSLAGSLDHDDSHVLLHTIPLFHANGWGFPQFATLCGMRQVTARRFEPRSVLALIEGESATRMILVPTMARMLLDEPGFTDFDLSSMREILVGGAAATPALIAELQQAFSCLAISGYGMTETGPVVSVERVKCTGKPPSGKVQAYGTSCGWPLLGVEVRVLDAQGLQVPRDGQTAGELMIRGDAVMSGYYDKTEATASAITKGWLHTGDLAVWDEELRLRIVDRVKDLIISGGENISSKEIEAAVEQHPDVLECAVIAAPDSLWGEVPIAIIVVKPGSRFQPEALLHFLSDRLARFKLPRAVYAMGHSLPRTGTGKVAKNQLRATYLNGE